jgi:hypothetical protein
MKGLRYVLGVAGVAMIGYAVVGAVTDSGVNLVGVAAFLGAVLIGHDLILLPIAVGFGVLLARVVPGWAYRWVLAGCAVSAIITAVAVPLLLGVGRIADDPSRLPLNYPRGLLIVLGVVWLVVLSGAGWSYRRSRRARSAE